MKRTARINFHSLLLTCLALVAAQTHAVAEEWPKNVDVSAQNLFAPVGFDDNDEAIVVIDGYLPSACHRLLDAQVTFKPGRKIVVAPRAREFKGVCPDVVVPFTQVVKLGQLSAGDYLVMSLDGRQLEKLNVKRATLPGPDDYLYAPVDRAWVNYPSTDRWTAVLEGRLTNSCLKIVETKIELTGTTVQLLPIMKFIPAACLVSYILALVTVPFFVALAP